MPETNAVAAAAQSVEENAEASGNGLVGMLMDGVESEYSDGCELWNQIVAWLSERGVSFCLNVVISILMLFVGWLVIRRIGNAVGKAVSKALTKSGKDNALFASFVASVTTKSCWALLIVMILSRLGVNVGPLVAGLGITGFILGFAFQESLGNLASGMMIAINQPFKVGDFVEAAGFAGSIVEVNMMATVLSTPDNKKVVIPNKSAWGSPIVNYSALGQRRVDMQVGIAYGSDVAKAREVIKATVAKVPGVLPVPAPTVAVGGLDESQVTINVRPWAACADYWDVYSGTLQSVKEALGKAGIEIPFPQITVNQAKA